MPVCRQTFPIRIFGKRFRARIFCLPALRIARCTAPTFKNVPSALSPSIITPKAFAKLSIAFLTATFSMPKIGKQVGWHKICLSEVFMWAHVGKNAFEITVSAWPLPSPCATQVLHPVSHVSASLMHDFMQQHRRLSHVSHGLGLPRNSAKH